MSPLRSRGFPDQRTKSGYITPIFLGAQDWAQLLSNPYRSGYLTPAFWGPKIGRN